MWTGGFPEPLTFSLRARRHLAARRGEFDVVHDNQTLGYGLLGRPGRPAGHHHPPPHHRRPAAGAGRRRRAGARRASVRRWYGFTRMQKRVARRLPSVLTVSGSSRQEIVDHLGVRRRPRPRRPHRRRHRPVLARSRRSPEVPGRIVTTSSADVPLKGLVHLVEALAKLRTEHPARAPRRRRQARRGRARSPQPSSGTGSRAPSSSSRASRDAELVDLVRGAQIACVPSLYEGFSLPAAEAMATGTPLVATTGGAIPEVAGPDGETCLAVPPGDAGALAAALGRLLGDAGLRARLGAAGPRARAAPLHLGQQAATRARAEPLPRRPIAARTPHAAPGRAAPTVCRCRRPATAPRRRSAVRIRRTRRQPRRQATC